MNNVHAGHGAIHGHGSSGQPHATQQGYLIGFGLSVVLTGIAFWLVMSGVIAHKGATAVLILALAAVQIVVHMVYFLHMNARSESGWSMMALIFTIVLVVIALTGSLWIMFHLSTNMMPDAATMRGMP